MQPMSDHRIDKNTYSAKRGKNIRLKSMAEGVRQKDQVEVSFVHDDNQNNTEKQTDCNVHSEPPFEHLRQSQISQVAQRSIGVKKGHGVGLAINGDEANHSSKSHIRQEFLSSTSIKKF